MPTHRHEFQRRLSRVAIAALAMAILPALASAQRGIGPSGIGSGRRGGGGISRDPGLAIPKQVNAVNLIIQNRQALALSDSQFARVVVIKRQVDSANAPLMRRLDSLPRVFKGGQLVFGNPSAEKRDSVATATALVRETEAEVRATISDGRDRAYSLLSESQLMKAQGFEQAAEKALAEETAGKGRGGRGG